jgi:hypothetical protein
MGSHQKKVLVSLPVPGEEEPAKMDVYSILNAGAVFCEEGLSAVSAVELPLPCETAWVLIWKSSHQIISFLEFGSVRLICALGGLSNSELTRVTRRQSVNDGLTWRRRAALGLEKCRIWNEWICRKKSRSALIEIDLNGV